MDSTALIKLLLPTITILQKENLQNPPTKLAFKDFLSRSDKTRNHGEKQQNRSCHHSHTNQGLVTQQFTDTCDQVRKLYLSLDMTRIDLSTNLGRTSLEGAVGQRRMTSQAAPHLRAKQANPKHLVVTISFNVISVSWFQAEKTARIASFINYIALWTKVTRVTPRAIELACLRHPDVICIVTWLSTDVAHLSILTMIIFVGLLSENNRSS
jgi:hypothetical protein